jgi:hypothetical protein
MTAEIVDLADRRKRKPPVVPSLIALSFGIFAAYLFVGTVTLNAIANLAKRR